MSDCRNHKKKLPHYGNDWNKLSEHLGDLRYNELAEILENLSMKLAFDAMKDSIGDKPKLSKQLCNAHIAIFFASEHIKEAWKVSKPHMKAN